MAELPSAVTSLVDAALGGDDPERLVAAAARELEAPLGLVGASGEPLGWAPRDGDGRRALAVAAAAARSGLVAPPGWRIEPVSRGSARLGFVAVRDEAGRPMLALVLALLADQLQRRELLRGRVAAFLRRLVTEPTAAARREGAELGLALADAYWPAVLSWRHATPRAEVVEALERETVRDGALIVALPSRAALLHPAAGARAWFVDVVACARRLAPAAGAQAVAADGPVGLAGLSARVAELVALSRLDGLAADGPPVLDARRYALERLLAGVVGAAEARAFVAEQLGSVEAWDRAHHGDLLTVLEAALDFPRHEQAARRCYMHRNTFRHRLRQAIEVLGHDLEDPDVRLATHVALKLRRVLGADVAPSIPRSARGRAPARRDRTRGRR
jgi:PucR C-terminal helix-turn-helix domain